MGMQRSAAVGQMTKRNFLRENKLSVRQTPAMTLRRFVRDPERNWPCGSGRWPLARYELPTAASIAHRSGTLPLVETQQRLLNSGRHGRKVCHNRQRSEKEIQTEDINDEEFLNAALLKCMEQAHGQVDQGPFKRICSEGDELPLPARLAVCQSNNKCLRRIVSNFELGTVPAQRSQLSMKHMYHREVGGVDDTKPTQLDELECHPSERVLQNRKGKADSAVDNVSVRSHASLPQYQVLQLAIPDVTDVEQEPQLDQPLSARTTASCHSYKPNCVKTQTDIEPDHANQYHHNYQNQGMCQKQDHDQVLLTEAQRITLLEAAQARQKKLIWEYNRLPLSMGTLRVRNLKVQLEQQLDVIDNDLSTLNLPQVYIKRDKLQQISCISC